MRIVIQRVSGARVSVEGRVVSTIGKGMLILLGIENYDTEEDSDWLVKKAIGLRIFNDDQGVMNLSVLETGGEVMVVSQFTLHASTKKGNRPSYIRAAKPDNAIPLYNDFLRRVQEATGRKPGMGIFGAMMDIELINEGPVTIIIDSRNRE